MTGVCCILTKNRRKPLIAPKCCLNSILYEWRRRKVRDNPDAAILSPSHVRYALSHYSLEMAKIVFWLVLLGSTSFALQEHPSVRAAPVAARGDRLVAYVVLSSPLAGIDSLCTHLQTRLPSYMVPVKLEILEALPVTPNGKIDRRALPSPIWDALNYVAPRTPTEHTIAGIWAGLLGREHVGVYDSLFELGGHWLLTTQAASRIRSILGVELSAGTVFDAPPVASFALALAKMPLTNGTTPQAIARVPRNLYRARVGADGLLLLDQPLRELLHLDDAGGLA